MERTVVSIMADLLAVDGCRHMNFLCLYVHLLRKEKMYPFNNENHFDENISTMDLALLRQNDHSALKGGIGNVSLSIALSSWFVATGVVDRTVQPPGD